MSNTYFKLGKTLLPPITGTNNSLLKDTDPVLYNLLEFYQLIIQRLTSRWNQEVTLAGMEDKLSLICDQVVAYPVDDLLNDNTFSFPLLVAYRVGGDSKPITAGHYSTNSNIHVQWILPPLSFEQRQYLYPFLYAVYNALYDRTYYGYDSSINNGKEYWKDAGLQDITVSSYKIGNMETSDSNDKKTLFPTLLLNVNFHERQEFDIRNTEPFTGLDGYIDMVPSPDGYVENNNIELIHYKFDPQLRIDSISPSSGSSGVEVLLHGNGFLNVIGGSLDNYPMLNFRVIDNSTIKFRTPTHDLGQVFIELYSTDGTTYLLNNAFTFT